MPFLIELWNSQHGMVWDRLTGTGLGWMRRPTFKCSQYTAPTFPIQLQYGTFGTGVATAQKFAQVWLQAGYDQKKCGNCCTSFPKIHCGSRWFWVLLENKKLQGSVVMSVSTTTQEYNCFDKHLNTSLLRKLWQPWLLGKPHWNSCCAPNHPGKGLDPPSNQANAHLILANSSLKKCPKPSGQGLRPPPPYGQCPNAPSMNLRKASLTHIDGNDDSDDDVNDVHMVNTHRQHPPTLSRGYILCQLIRTTFIITVSINIIISSKIASKSSWLLFPAELS